MIVFTLQDHKSGTVCEDYLAYFWFVCDNLKNYLKNKQKKKTKNQKHLDLQSQREPFMVLTFGLGSKKLRCYTAWTADTTTANISHTQQTDLALCVCNVTPQHFNNTI